MYLQCLRYVKNAFLGKIVGFERDAFEVLIRVQFLRQLLREPVFEVIFGQNYTFKTNLGNVEVL